MTKSETSDDIQPRPEARPLKWDELTDPQKDAAKRAGGLLRKIAEKKWEAPKAQPSGVDLFLPPIDPERVNHVVLIDGGRGTGKTALLVTLLHAWSWGVRNDTGSASEEDAPPEELRELLQPLGQIVPVGLVDLQPLPDSTNLLLHIVGRFHRVVEAIEQDRGSEGARPPWHAVEEDEPQCRTRWRDFLRAAADGWNHGLEGRRANLDPEAYTIEVEQAERRRLDVVSSFRGCIDALVEDYKRFRRKPKGAEPLFLISIDDADMNLGRSVELLDLVRTLWHPRVAFLLTGHSDLFLETLNAHEFRSMSAPTQRTNGLGSQVRYKPRNRIHERMANQIYEKVIPPEHRLKLSALSATERFSRICKLFDGKGETSQRSVRAERIKSLFDTYRNLHEALPGSLRRILDLEQWLSFLLAQTPTPDAEPDESQVLRRLWSSALEEAPQSSGIADRIGEWLQWSTDSRVIFRTKSALTFKLFPTQLTSHQVPGVEAVTVGTGLRTTAIGDKEPLSDGIVGCLQALLDLGMGDGAFRIEMAMHHSIEGDAFCAVNVASKLGIHRIGWKLPNWGKFSEFISFSKRWSAAAHELVKQPELDMTKLAQSYIASILSESRVSKNKKDKRGTDWSTLAHSVMRMAFSGGDKGSITPSLRDWARRGAGLLAAPESGLPADAANAWLEALQGHEKWSDLKADLVESRRNKLHAAIDELRFDTLDSKATNQLVAELKMRFRAHAWHHEVESDPAALLGGILRQMERIGVPSSRSKNLQEYMTRSRIDEFLGAPVALLERMNTALRTFARQSGIAALPTIEMIWKLATQATDESMQSLIRLSNSRLYVPTGEIFQRLGRPHLERDPRASGLILDQGAKDKLGIGLQFARIAWGQRKEVGHILHAIYRIAWDIAADGLGELSPVLPPWWSVAGARFANSHELIPWPTALWSTFVDWERLIDAWNLVIMPKLYDLSAQAGSTGGSLDIYGDAAAFWLASATSHLSVHRCDLSDTKLELGANGERWKNWVSSEYTYRQQNLRDLRPHMRIYVNWVERIGLFAAPESGLSRDVAEGILAGIPDLAQRRQQLIQLRKERLAFIGFNSQEARMRLDLFNEDFADHPWTLQVEKPEGSAGSPPPTSDPSAP